MKIEPRKPSDRGGWLCMPRLENCPEGKPGWEKVNCPVCGDPCWKRPEDAGVIEKSKLDGAACTLCALKLLPANGLQDIGKRRELRKELQARCDLTELQAVNIINGFHIPDYVKIAAIKAEKEAQENEN